MHKRFEAVFLDLDGTLVDSIPLMYQVYRQFLSQFLITGSRKEFNELNGPSLTEIVAFLKSRHRLDGAEEHLLERYRKSVKAAYASSAHPIRGAVDLLKQLCLKGYRVLLVTSAEKNLVSRFIKKQKWNKYFEALIFGNDVKCAKPHPEIYQTALRKSALPPAKVAVVEDSPNGVMSAKAAGLFVIGIVGHHSAKELIKAGADATVSSLSKVFRLLESKNYGILTAHQIRLIEVPLALDIQTSINKKQKIINLLWKKYANPQNFNGDLFIFTGRKKYGGTIVLKGSFVEYKVFFAQTLNPKLLPRIRPISISGITLIKDKTGEYALVGKRSAHVTQFPGHWELAPSGCIDRKHQNQDASIDYKLGLLSEFQEETGLSKGMIRLIAEFAIIYDTDAQIYDVCCRLDIKAPKTSILSRLSLKEYVDFKLVPSHHLNEFLATRLAVVPTSAVLGDLFLNSAHLIKRINLTSRTRN